MAGPGEISITLTVEPGKRVNDSLNITAVSFSLFDQNAEKLASKKVSTYDRGGTGQTVARVEVTRKQIMMLSINIPEESNYNGVGGKYRVRLDGAVNFGQGTPSSGGSDYDEFQRQLASRKPECLWPKKGILRVKMKDGSIKKIDLSQAEEITIRP
jgi:hypothetical protein